MEGSEKFIRESEMNAIADNQIDLSDIPEITDFSRGHFRNRKPVKKPVCTFPYTTNDKVMRQK